MRDILFRGKDFLGKWIQGDLLQYRGFQIFCIVQNYIGANGREVVPETVGQYTGLTDKNGKKIFEGDIIERFWFGEKHTYQIDYDNNIASFIGKDIYGFKFTSFDYDACEFEIIGNIYDNPELLEAVK